MKARLHLQLTDTAGRVVDDRRAHNTVMQGGAQLIADLFAGKGTSITHMGVGTSDATPDDVGVLALTNGTTGGDDMLAGDTLGAIPTESFTAQVVPERRVVQVRVRATLPNAAAVGRIREAGLVSATTAGTVLYNRVVFAPVDKRNDHELTLFWEVDFPFGELQWLS